MSGICDTCKRNNDCRRPMDGMDSCRLYVSGKESNYKKLFGTPERAARTLAVNCYGATSDACDTCVHADCDGTLRNKPVLSAVYDALIEWLRGDAE